MSRPPLLVVGWPGADWFRLHPLLDTGEMPTLAALVESGTSGPLTAVEPLSHASLWTTLATGQPAPVHGVLGDTEVDPGTGEIFPVTACSWRAPAYWHTLANDGLRCHVVGWPASHLGASLPHGGVMVTDSYPLPTALPGASGVAGWPLLPGTVHATDPEIVAALAELRVSPAEIDAELLAGFVPRWDELDHALDPRPRRLAMALAETWSVHNATTFLLQTTPPDALFVHYPLLERLAALFLPCSPSSADALLTVSPRHMELYGGVISAACRWLDEFLARLQSLADTRATIAVVSPSGYGMSTFGLPLAVGAFPPTANLSSCRRPVGMFAAAGPSSGVRPDALVHGTSVLDFTSLLACLMSRPLPGEPRASFLRLAREIFESALSSASVSSDAAICPAISTPVDPDLESRRSFRTQLLSTGAWTNLPSAASIRHEHELALARAWTQEGQDHLACPVLEALHTAVPEDPAVAFALTLCCLRLGFLPAARAAAETVFDHAWRTPQADLLRGHFAYCAGRYEDALESFQAAGRAGNALTGWENQLGLALLKLGRFAEADEAFGRAIVRDPADADAWLGRGHARLRLQDYAGAEEASRVAVSCRYASPLAHFNWGLSLARLLDNQAAIQRMRTVLELLNVAEHGSSLAERHPLAIHTWRILAILERRLQKPSVSQN
ncbi:MAG: alkaline phosphatase family protein [Rhodospirillales bacterium]|nr:alkaline phosphatase family protein [Acetobacter sp.]